MAGDRWTPPKRFGPHHLQICILHWDGLKVPEIAKRIGCSKQLVSNILNCPEGLEILEQFRQRTLDTVLDTQIAAQAYAPQALETLVHLMLESKDDRVRKTACTDILAMAGHQPVKRIAVERPEQLEEKYRGMSDDEIKQLVLRELGATDATAAVEVKTADGSGHKTVH